MNHDMEANHQAPNSPNQVPRNARTSARRSASQVAGTTHLSLAPFRLLLIFTILLNAAALYTFVETVDRTKLPHPRLWMLMVAAGALALIVELALLIISWTPYRGVIDRIFNTITQILGFLRWLNPLLFAASIALFAYTVLGPYSEHLGSLALRSFMFWAVTLLGCVLLKAWAPLEKGGSTGTWGAYLGMSLLFTTFGYKAATFLPGISTYPYTLDWSEASRYYYASLFFAERIYEVAIPPTVLHPSRYMMQAVPFLLPESPLWLHRAWQVFLWLGTTLLTSFLLARRLYIKGNLKPWLLIAWSFVFLLLGPVYYHLQVPVILVLWGYNRGDRLSPRLRLLKSIVVVLLASAWAGISRVNWVPVPGMLAATLYFLENPSGIPTSPKNFRALIKGFFSPNPNKSDLIGLQSSKFLHKTQRNDWLGPKDSFWPYLLEPIAWTIAGTLAAFAAQALYVVWSGNAAEEFATSFSSDLLWYRLLPNSTYPPGILPAILIISLPMFMLIASNLLQLHEGKRNWQRYHPIRFLGLAALLGVLFTGGLVVSTKIGGGSNLHNLDAYMVLLLVITVYFLFERAAPDLPYNEIPFTSLPDEGFEGAPQKMRRVSITLSLVIPAVLTILSSSPPAPLPTQEQINKSLEAVTRHIEQASHYGGEVLFISNRQMLIFNELEGVALVPEYERVFLMEMAMAGDPQYLNTLRDDLSAHRFALIVSEPLYIQSKGSSERFGEENDAWVNQVSKRILQYYQPRKTWQAVRIQILTPKAKPGR